jgi:hypothetical protein
MWLEIRADRTLVEVMARIVPDAPGRSHGTDLAEPRHAAALTTALRYQAAAGAATSRAPRALFAHRKALKDGLVEPPGTAPSVPEPANQNSTNELPPGPD